jgi:hypothetical protein
MRELADDQPCSKELSTVTYSACERHVFSGVPPVLEPSIQNETAIEQPGALLTTLKQLRADDHRLLQDSSEDHRLLQDSSEDHRLLQDSSEESPGVNTPNLRNQPRRRTISLRKVMKLLSRKRKKAHTALASATSSGVLIIRPLPRVLAAPVTNQLFRAEQLAADFGGGAALHLTSRGPAISSADPALCAWS